MRRVVAGCLLVAFVWIAAGATADPQNGIVISYYDEQDGRGWLVANPTPDGAWGRMSCRKRRGGPCKVISDDPYWDPCPDTAARLPRRYLGWFVRVADFRYARVPIVADRKYLHAEDLTPSTPDGRTAVVTVGRIRPGRGPSRPC
jgi:hypothetical protein